MLWFVCPWDGAWQKQSLEPFWVISGRLGTALGPHPRDRVDLGCVPAILRKEPETRSLGQNRSETRRARLGARGGQSQSFRVKPRRKWGGAKSHRRLQTGAALTSLINCCWPSCKGFPLSDILKTPSSSLHAGRKQTGPRWTVCVCGLEQFHTAVWNKLTSLPGLRAFELTTLCSYTVISEHYETPLLVPFYSWETIMIRDLPKVPQLFTCEPGLGPPPSSMAHLESMALAVFRLCSIQFTWKAGMIHYSLFIGWMTVLLGGGLLVSHYSIFYLTFPTQTSPQCPWSPDRTHFGHSTPTNAIT